jgi:hypothetical protein
MNGLLGALFAVFIVGCSAFPLNYHHNFVIVLKDNGFEKQHGSVTELKFKSGLIVRKTQTISHGNGNSLPTEQELSPGGRIRGHATLVKDDLSKTRSISFKWESDESNSGAILVDSIFFRPNEDYPPQILRRFSKMFCHDGPINSGEAVTFKEC